MPQEKKLGFDRDKNVFVKEYLTHLGLYWDGKFGRMTEYLKDRQPRDYHDPEAIYIHTDADGVEIDPPTETQVIQFLTFKSKMKDFQSCQATWRDTSPKMCTDLITNTLVKSSQERLMRLKKAEVDTHRANGNVLRLLTTVIDVHKYKGEIIDDQDRSRITYLRLMQRAETYGIITDDTILPRPTSQRRSSWICS